MKRRAVTKVEVLIALIVISIVVALIIPAVQKTREAAARTQSTNNLKQIAMCFASFHDVNKRLPFNGSDKAVGNAKYSAEAILYSPTSGSWGFQVMPYADSRMDEAPKLTELGFAYLHCPFRGRPYREEGRGAWTVYYINNYLNDPGNAETPNNADAKRQFKEITDGAAYTIFVGEGNISAFDYEKTSGVVGSSNIFLGGTFGTARAGPNSKPGKTPGVALRRDTEEPPDFAAGGWGGPFPQGGLMGFGDSSVRMVPYSTPPEIFGAFLTPTGAEDVALPD